METKSNIVAHIPIVLDWFQGLSALLIGISLILDNWGFLTPVTKFLPSGLQFDSAKLTLILVGVIAFTSLLERRFQLEGLHKKIDSSSRDQSAQFKRIEEIIANMQLLGQKMHLRGVSDIYRNRRDCPPLDEYLGKAKSDTLIVGITLVGIFKGYQNLLEQSIKNGCSFRFLLPASLPGEKSITHLADGNEVRRTQNNLIETFEQIDGLTKKMKRLKAKGKVEVRVFDFVPTMGVIMLDSRSNNGTIRIELYPYASLVGKRPAFELQPTDDPDCLYNYFRERYEELWVKSRTFDLNAKCSGPIKLDRGESEYNAQKGALPCPSIAPLHPNSKRKLFSKHSPAPRRPPKLAANTT